MRKLLVWTKGKTIQYKKQKAQAQMQFIMILNTPPFNILLRRTPDLGKSIYFVRHSYPAMMAVSSFTHTRTACRNKGGRHTLDITGDFNFLEPAVVSVEINNMRRCFPI